MSFLGPADLGATIDADAIRNVALELSALARSMVADFVGPTWVSGCEAKGGTDALGNVTAEISEGLVYPIEPQQAVGETQLDLSVRSRQLATRSVPLPANAFHFVALRADESDEQLASLAAYSSVSTAELDGLQIPDGVVPLALLTCDYQQVVSTHDMRAFAWEEVSGPGGQTTVQSSLEWVVLPDTAQVVLLRDRPNEGVLVRFEATVEDKFAGAQFPYPEVQFMLFDNGTPMSSWINQFGTTRPEKGQLVWMGFLTGAPGLHILTMRCRAASAGVNDATLTVMHVPGEVLPPAHIG